MTLSDVLSMRELTICNIVAEINIGRIVLFCKKVLYLSGMKTIKIEDSTHKALKIFCANYSRNMSVEADYAILDHIDVEEKKSIKQKIKKKPNDTIPTNHPTNRFGY